MARAPISTGRRKIPVLWAYITALCVIHSLASRISRGSCGKFKNLHLAGPVPLLSSVSIDSYCSLEWDKESAEIFKQYCQVVYNASCSGF